MKHPKPETIHATDGHALAARFYTPGAAYPVPRVAVLIVPARGVSQEYYADFANWRALHGYAVATFD